MLIIITNTHKSYLILIILIKMIIIIPCMPIEIVK